MVCPAFQIVRTKVLIVIVCGLLGFALARNTDAQPGSFRVLHAFSGPDGANPIGNLILSEGALYGVANMGGDDSNGGQGAVFEMSSDGSDFTNLYIFSGSDGWGPNYLTLSDGVLYGVTGGGGSNSDGVVFRLDATGGGFTNIYTFEANEPAGLDGFGTNFDGFGPDCIVAYSNMLFGVTSAGTTISAGGVFSLGSDGLDFTNVYEFAADTGGNVAGFTTGPKLIASGNTLFGTTIGNNAPYPEQATSFGAIFRVATDGSCLTNLYTFTNGVDGSMPVGVLTLSGDVLYGTAALGGSGSNGTVFSIHTDGSGFTTLHAFAASTPNNIENLINSDGSRPWSALTLCGNALYGTTAAGGSSGSGTLFRVNIDGSGFTNLYFFTALVSGSLANSDGILPQGNLILCGNTLYGMALEGGPGASGAIFSFALPLPQLGIVAAGGQMTISWPGWASHFQLQTADDVSSSSWSTLTNGISFDGTNYNFTPISGEPATFFRLGL